MKHDQHYRHFLNTPSQAHWEKIGTQKRAGVAAPLFSLYSRSSIGVGEIPDLKLMIDWCRQTRLSILLLLPMNDVGFDFRPYDAQSTFALEPMYLSLKKIKKVPLGMFRARIEALKKRFPAGGELVDNGVKAAKLELMWDMFKSSDRASKRFHGYIERNSYWLYDYALFKVLKEIYGGNSWEAWPEVFKFRNPESLESVRKEHAEAVQYHMWLQWQLYEQFSSVKRYAAKKKVFLMGDLPFLVSRDSADVWAHQDYFKLDLASGAPPDAYMALGQRWGMPPYRWDIIEKDQFRYLIERLHYAENFYDMIRIDHFVGFFRVWTVWLHEPRENFGLYGSFDPREEVIWEAHGRRLVSLFLEHSKLLPCAEDLGVVPPCSFKALEDFGLPGMDIQRWMRDWGKTFSFKSPSSYRKNSMVTVSTHDMSNLKAWWEFEVGTVDAEMIRRMCFSRGVSEERLNSVFDLEKSAHGRLRWKREIKTDEALLAALGLHPDQAKDILENFHGCRDEKERFWKYLGLEGRPTEDCPPILIERSLEKAHETASIFSVHLLQEWLSIDPDFRYDPWTFRVNFPGYVKDTNWRLVVPKSLEDLKRWKLNRKLRELNKKTGRC